MKQQFLTRTVLMFLFLFVAHWGGASAQTANYQKVTHALDDYAGEYLIVNDTEGKLYVLDGSLTALDAANNYVKPLPTASSDIITVSPSYAVTIETVAGGYSIKTASGYYIFHSGTSNTLNSSNTQATANTITVAADGEASIKCGNYYLRFNATSGQTRFRYYKSGQKAVSLYKRVDGDPLPSTPSVSFDAQSYGPLTLSAEGTASVQLSATASNASDATISYSVDPAEGASVSEAGLFTATQAGTYAVTASVTVDGETYTSTPVNIVVNAYVPPVQVPTGSVALVATDGDGWYAASNEMAGTSKYYFRANAVNVVNNKALNIADNLSNCAWTLTDEGSSNITLQPANDLTQYLARSNTSTGSKLTVTKTKLTLTAEGLITSTFTTTSGTTDGARHFGYNDQVDPTRFTFYALSNTGQFPPAKALPIVDGYARTTSAQWGTLCLPAEVAEDDYAGFTAYTVSGYTVDDQDQPNSLVVEPVQGALTAGQPYVYCLTEGSTKLLAPTAPAVPPRPQARTA